MSNDKTNCQPKLAIIATELKMSRGVSASHPWLTILRMFKGGHKANSYSQSEVKQHQEVMEEHTEKTYDPASHPGENLLSSLPQRGDL